MWLVETTGGIGFGGARTLKACSRCANDKKRGRDGTAYSVHRATSYFTHHLRAISSAAVFGNAAHIERLILAKKTRAADYASKPRGAEGRDGDGPGGW